MATGIALLNPELKMAALSPDESLTVQKVAADRFIREFGIIPLVLNPHQLNNYYTIPHALLFDLKKYHVSKVDYLILYSLRTVERFQYIYPEKWTQLICSFHQVTCLDSRICVFPEVG
ncbi:hypothetical protein [Peribacillus sp. SCS-155]|uniref:hypothetical protein n=1 Tax=Peribacillus sedimenti TaxID=3115297 RepID=UPI0039068E29